MIDKIKDTIQKNKKYLIAFSILWLILTIVFVVPLSYSIKNSLVEGSFSLEVFIQNISSSITKPLSLVGEVFKVEYISMFFSVLWKFSLVYIIALIVGIYRARPKSEYDGTEHGSSGWCENGEQYRVLSKKDGIILSESNYLPLSKLGNINVLIVGRFWCW